MRLCRYLRISFFECTNKNSCFDSQRGYLRKISCIEFLYRVWWSALKNQIPCTCLMLRYAMHYIIHLKQLGLICMYCTITYIASIKLVLGWQKTKMTKQNPSWLLKAPPPILQIFPFIFFNVMTKIKEEKSWNQNPGVQH